MTKQEENRERSKEMSAIMVVLSFAVLSCAGICACIAKLISLMTE